MSYRVICLACGSEVTASPRPHCSCGHSQLEIKYNPPEYFLAQLGKKLEVKSMWSYAPLLPVHPNTEPVTLGEGDTPLIRTSNLAKHLGIRELYLKLEGANPTGSFKDRCASVGVTRARQDGYKAISIASAGNAAASASAYAARAGLDCWVFVPKGTPPDRIVPIALHGAKLLQVEGSVNDCSDLVDVASERFTWLPVTTASIKNLYQAEAPRTIAFELWHQLDHRIPDWIIAPVGGGGLLSSIAQGWRDLLYFGLIDRLPRLVAVQAEGCAPLIRAVLKGTTPDGIESWGPPTTRVTSIADPFPMDGARAMRALKEHGGIAVSIDDVMAFSAEAQAARLEGIFIEPASAIALAAVEPLVAQGKILPDEQTVIIASGVGFKDMQIAASLINEPPIISSDVDAMFAAVEQLI
jgi:threonine synthase